MKWCQFEGTTFDRSKVTHFTLDNYPPGNDDGYWVLAWLPVMNGESGEGGVVGQKHGRIGQNGTQSSREQAILDICAGKYDVPGQSRFIELPLSGGYETDYFNIDHIVRIQYHMGGVSVYDITGKAYEIGCMSGDGPLRGDYKKVTDLLASHFGLTDFGDWMVDPESDASTPAPVLKLYRTSLLWNGEPVYEEPVKNSRKLMFWIMDAMNQAHALLLNGKQITSETIGGLVDMASEMDGKHFDGDVHIEGRKVK